MSSPRAVLSNTLWVLISLVLAIQGLAEAAAQSTDDAFWSNRFGVPGLNNTNQGLLPSTPGRLCQVHPLAAAFVLPRNDGQFETYLFACWDGEGWTVEGPGFLPQNQSISALEVWGTDIYMGGNFTLPGEDQIRNLARWDGQYWWPVAQTSSQIDGQVRVLVFDGTSSIYAGGDFRGADGKGMSQIGRWDSEQWHPLFNTGEAAEGVNGSVFDIAVSGSGVYAAGTFTNAAGANAFYVAHWNRQVPVWSGLAGGPGAPATELEVADGKVYVAGGFFAQQHSIVQWDGAGWSPLGDGSAQAVTVIEGLNNGELLASGSFFGGLTPQLAKWDGVSQWVPLGGVSDLSIYRIAAKSFDDIYVSLQSFTGSEFPGVVHNGIVRWNGSEWTGLGEGIGLYWSFGTSEGIHALANYGREVYAGGQFTSAGPRTINALARWDGGRWSDVGGDSFSSNDIIYALKSHGGSLYVGGGFDTAGSEQAKGIARWDGSRWHALGEGVGAGTVLDPVRALEFLGGDLIAGGDFRIAGGVPVVGIARWDGVVWSEIAGFAGSVLAMATDGGRLFVGGEFTLDGWLTRTHVARWDGTDWTHLGSVSGQLATVQAIAHGIGGVYVGGAFTAIEGVSANMVARWDGTSWHPMGNGLPGPVYSLWVEGEDVYAAGSFSGTADNPIFGIAKWNGLTWTSLGIGVHKHLNFPATPTVWTLLGTAEGLYLGGNFTHAGGSYSNQIALWTNFTSTVDMEESAGNIPSEFSLHQNYPNPFASSTSIRFFLGRREAVDLRVYDVLGREVALLVHEAKAPGSYEVEWEAKGLSSGLYFYRLKAGEFARTRQLVLMR